MSVAKTFSMEPAGDDKSRDPVDRLMQLTAKWRRERGLDDSAENLRTSALAVMKANPKLAKQYQLRPTTLSQARSTEDPWMDQDMGG